MTTLYRIYGDRRELIYVGITDDYDRRMRSHSEKAWWLEIRGITTEEFADRASAEAAEASAIRAEGPKYNRAHTGKPAREFIAPRAVKGADTSWMTIADAARYLQVSQDTIRRRVADGSLEAKRFGPRLIRVNTASLDLSGRDVGNWRNR